ncbi:hypothetical protein CMUS01_13879 [Colletotrichum musicola]|uniref:Uncharacterized protein n=1 Tax=Colletotrichum musicola TaxID=2175873 RepID=A0A8H6J9A1_9PEZI|nr:hypothetical protein CMUS01_13879 [Colletotrichum musicola]
MANQSWPEDGRQTRRASNHVASVPVWAGCVPALRARGALEQAMFVVRWNAEHGEGRGDPNRREVEAVSDSGKLC